MIFIWILVGCVVEVSWGLIHIFGCNFGLNLSYIEGVSDLKCIGEKQLKSRGFRDENEGAKSGIFGQGLGESHLPEHDKSSYELWPLAHHAIHSTTKISLIFEGWRPAPLRAPGTPVLFIPSPPFSTCSLAMYQCFLVDSNTLRYI